MTTRSGKGLSRRAFLQVGTVGAVCGAVAGLSSCSGAPDRLRARPQLRQGGLDVRDYGAVGDGRTDDSVAIDRALRALRPGGTLTFPQGVYAHSTVLVVSTPGAWLQGPGRLHATAEQTSALQIMADGVTVSTLVVSMGTTTQRWGAPDQHKIFLGGFDDITLQNVAVVGSAAAGVFAFGAGRFHLDRVSVRDTRADGIHMTNGSHHGRLDRPSISRSGDDGVAVVSYVQDARPCSDIVVSAPRIDTTTGGRGVSVVGGHDVVYDQIDVFGSSAAGVYVACEGGDFVTRSTERVSVTGGRVAHANTDAAIDHGAILVYSGRAGGAVRDVTVADLSVTGTRSTASRQIGVVADSAACAVSDVTFRCLDLQKTPPPYQGDAPVSDVSLRDVRADGVSVRPAG